MKFATKPMRHYPSQLSMFIHYLGKFKIHVFCRYLADMEESANNAFLSPLTLLFIHKL